MLLVFRIVGPALYLEIVYTKPDVNQIVVPDHVLKDLRVSVGWQGLNKTSNDFIAEQTLVKTE